MARLFELETRCERLERAVKGIDTDWSEWFDKFRRLYARIAKRQERDEEPTQSLEDASGTTNGQDAPPDPYVHPMIGTAHLSRRFRGT